MAVKQELCVVENNHSHPMTPNEWRMQMVNKFCYIGSCLTSSVRCDKE